MPRTVSSVPSMALSNEDGHRSSKKSRASKKDVSPPRIPSPDRMDAIRLGGGGQAQREAHQARLNGQLSKVDRLFPNTPKRP